MRENIIIFDKAKDEVINSVYLTVKTTYKFALEELVPLINNLQFQRNTLDKKMYRRLENDLLNGCIMPPITIAFNNQELMYEIKDKTIEEIMSSGLIENHIKNAFILDGIQRLNTLNTVANEGALNLDLPLYANIIFSDSMNKLLYRMIILNNGQKPMTPRHQIEILMKNLLVSELEGFKNNEFIFSEKEQMKKNSKNKIKEADLIKGYLAFVSQSKNIDNQKIIETKLNEIITGKIIDAQIMSYKYEFKDILKYILSIIELEKEKEFDYQFPVSFTTWITNENNLIGFCAGVSQQNEMMNEDRMENEVIFAINKMEDVLNGLNVSKIKVSKTRRFIAEWMVLNFDKLLNELTTEDIIYKISEQI